MNPRRRCEYCGGKLPTDSPLAKYCKESCRQLAYQKRKKQSGANLSGIESKPEIVLENFHLEKPQPQTEQSEPVRNTPEIKKPSPEKPKPQQPTFVRNKFSDFPQDDFSMFDDLEQSENDTRVIFNTPQQTEKQTPVNYQSKKTQMPDGLSLDQRMAYEMMNGDYGDFNDATFLQDSQAQNPKPETEPTQNNPQGWKPIPFAEPEPVKVEPKYQMQTTRVYTPESQKLISQKDAIALQLPTLIYENGLVKQVLNTIAVSPTKICVGWKPYSTKSEAWNKLTAMLSPLNELLSRGSLTLINNGIICATDLGTQQQHEEQVTKLKAKQQEYQTQINKLTEQNAQINNRLSYWEAQVTVRENILLNKNEFENYVKQLEAWKQRKKVNDEKQIREREEFIKQQQKIMQLGEIPKTQQTKQPEIIQPKNPVNTNETKNNNQIRPITQTQKTPEQTPKPVQIIQPKQQRKIETNGMIVNSFDVHKYAEDIYPFVGRYGDFLGHLPVSFEMAVHGKPGMGKSIFCYRFAKYLADNWGRVIYIASEEGLGRTTEDKLEELGCKSTNLDFSNCRDLETIFQNVRKGDYKFIFLDSLKHIGIDYAAYLELRGHFTEEAIISIQQSTKAGEMAGEQSIKHEIDVELSVSKGYAEVGKTRALHGRSGLIFDIFPETGRSSPNEEVAVI